MNPFVLLLFAAACLFFLFTVFHITFTQIAHAATYPHEIHTNRDACRYFKNHGAGLRGASIEQLTSLCANEGIDL